jgi:hypothetical protein
MSHCKKVSLIAADSKIGESQEEKCFFFFSPSWVSVRTTCVFCSNGEHVSRCTPICDPGKSLRCDAKCVRFPLSEVLGTRVKEL